MHAKPDGEQLDCENDGQTGIRYELRPVGRAEVAKKRINVGSEGEVEMVIARQLCSYVVTGTRSRRQPQWRWKYEARIQRMLQGNHE